MLAFKRIVLKLASTLGVFFPILFCYEQVKLRQILLLILILRSYYLHQMKNREAIDSDLKVPASVQEQNRHNIRTPIHRRGEQTLNKQAKTDGRKKGFATNTNAVANRSYQAKNLSCLHKMCNLTTTSNIYKQTRPSYILRSGDMVFKVINTFKNHYINPFNPFLWKKKHFTNSVLMLNCLLGILIIFSYYMKREKIFAKIFSHIESLQQQKAFMIRSREIKLKC